MRVAVVVNPTSGKRRGAHVERLRPLPLTAIAMPGAQTMVRA